jgi:hypothetical protein
MSAFDRLPPEYLELCKKIGENSVARGQKPLSPQNRRVRFAADLHLAHRRAAA